MIRQLLRVRWQGHLYPFTTARSAIAECKPPSKWPRGGHHFPRVYALVSQIGLSRLIFQTLTEHEGGFLARRRDHTLSFLNGSDPAAGSPTATLLRLLLPLTREHWADLAFSKGLRPYGKSS